MQCVTNGLSPLVLPSGRLNSTPSRVSSALREQVSLLVGIFTERGVKNLNSEERAEETRGSPLLLSGLRAYLLSGAGQTDALCKQNTLCFWKEVRGLVVSGTVSFRRTPEVF